MALENVVEVHNGKVVGAYASQAKNVSYKNGSVEDALDGLIALPKIKYFDVTVPVTSTSYNYSASRPSDFSLPLAAFSVQGGGAVITQIAPTTIYFESATVNQSKIRILYVAI